MTRTEFNKKLETAIGHASELENILKELLDVVEVDQQFKKDLGMYKTIDGDFIPKWEKRDVIVNWSRAADLHYGLRRHLDNCKSERDTLQ